MFSAENTMRMALRPSTVTRPSSCASPDARTMRIVSRTAETFFWSRPSTRRLSHLRGDGPAGGSSVSGDKVWIVFVRAS